MGDAEILNHVEIAIKLLNNDTELILKLIKKRYVSPIFGTVGEHFVYLRRVDVLKSICASLEDEQIADKNTVSHDSTSKNSNLVSDFISSFLPLSKKLKYAEITLYFDENSIKSPLRSGLLQKYTNVFNGFKTRYVVLYDDCIAYYKIRNGRKFLRKELSLNTIKDVKISNSRLIIKIYGEKIIFCSNIHDIVEWYRAIDKLLKRMNDREFYVNSYIFRILYYICNSRVRNQLKKIKHMALYVNDSTIFGIHGNEAQVGKLPYKTSKQWLSNIDNADDVTMDCEMQQNDDDEFESASENNINEMFYDLEDNNGIINFCYVTGNLCKNYSASCVTISLSSLEPHSFLERLAEGVLLLKILLSDDFLLQQMDVTKIVLFMMVLFNLQLQRKIPFKCYVGETYCLKHENTKIYCENGKKNMVMHAFDQFLEFNAIIDAQFRIKNKKVCVNNNSKFVIHINGNKFEISLPNIRFRKKIRFYGNCLIKHEKKIYKLFFHDNMIICSFRNHNNTWRFCSTTKQCNIFYNEELVKQFHMEKYYRMYLESYDKEKPFLPTDSRLRLDIDAFKKGHTEKIDHYWKQIQDSTKNSKTDEMLLFKLENGNYVLRQ